MRDRGGERDGFIIFFTRHGLQINPPLPGNLTGEAWADKIWIEKCPDRPTASAAYVTHASPRIPFPARARVSKYFLSKDEDGSAFSVSFPLSLKRVSVLHRGEFAPIHHLYRRNDDN